MILATAYHEQMERATGRLLTCQRLQLSVQSHFSAAKNTQRGTRSRPSQSSTPALSGALSPCFVAAHAVQAWQ